jgi:hypothetical protein
LGSACARRATIACRNCRTLSARQQQHGAAIERTLSVPIGHDIDAWKSSGTLAMLRATCI